MMRRYRKKIHKKYRGSRTCGGGNTKNRRGRGSRMTSKGTFGRNFMHFRKYHPEHYMKKGFNNPNRKEVNPITLDELSKLVLRQNLKEIDLKEFGYNKLLGSGNINVPVVVKVEKATESAIKKIESAGGQVITG